VKDFLARFLKKLTPEMRAKAFDEVSDKEFLARFLTYNTEMLAKASDEDLADHDHYRNQVWLRASIPARPHGPQTSWIGGDPKLPDPFRWPSRDGQPYQFLCQIDCATLPRELWGGLGPRTGWLAFFSTISGSLDVKVIYAPQLGPERKCENSWHKSCSTLHHLDDSYDSVLLPRPRWTLERVVAAAGEKNPPDRFRKPPFRDEVISIADPRHQPRSWQTLELLVSVALSQARKWHQRYTALARELAESMDTPSDALKATLAEIVQAADELLWRLQALGDRQPFGIESWLSQAELIMRLTQLDDEVSLNDDLPFSFVLKSFDLKGFAFEVRLFEADARQLSRIEDIMKLVAELEKEMECDPKLPPAAGIDRARWRQYRMANAAEWNGYADRVRHIRKLYYEYGLDHYLTLSKLKRLPTIVFTLIMGKPPEDLDTALMQVRAARDSAAGRLDKIENGDPKARRELQALQEKRAETESFERQLSGLQAQLHDRRPDAPFDAADWTSLYETLDEKEKSRILSDFWATDYETVRSELAKRTYADDPAALHPAARDYFETRWAFDAQQATLQIGGRPRGWCAKFIEQMPKSVMLLQLPTNHLTLFSCGDVDDLVVSISESDLARCNFSNVWVDVSN
jgi:uncharacterized protein YwqG